MSLIHMSNNEIAEHLEAVYSRDSIPVEAARRLRELGRTHVHASPCFLEGEDATKNCPECTPVIGDPKPAPEVPEWRCPEFVIPASFYAGLSDSTVHIEHFEGSLDV